MRVLVTGGSRFMGAHVYSEPQIDGYPVRVLDKLIPHVQGLDRSRQQYLNLVKSSRGVHALRRSFKPSERSMRFSLINSAWRFDGSVYFGCRETHLPLEFRYANVLLERAVAVRGECEEILPKLAGSWSEVGSICCKCGDEIHLQGSPHSSNMAKLPPLRWGTDSLARHFHHHHRFDPPSGPGAEMEMSRGCPYLAHEPDLSRFDQLSDVREENPSSVNGFGTS